MIPRRKIITRPARHDGSAQKRAKESGEAAFRNDLFVDSRADVATNMQLIQAYFVGYAVDLLRAHL